MEKIRMLLSHEIRNRQQERKDTFYSKFNEAIDFDEYLSNRFICYAPTGKYLDLDKESEQFFTDRLIKSLMVESELYRDVSSSLTAFKKGNTGLVTVEGIEYNPSNDVLYRVGDAEYFNLYKAPNLTRREPTENEKAVFTDYLTLLAPDREERAFLLQWIAHVAKHPEQRTQVGVLLYGKSNGAGKGTFQELISGLVGTSNTFKPANSAAFITGRFKAELKTKKLLILDELYHEGFKVSNAVKPLVTEPTIALEGKGKDQVMAPAWFEIVASSNAVQPLWLEKQDRRWFCLRVEKPSPINDDVANVEFNKIVREFRTWLVEQPVHSLEVIRFILDEVNLTDFKPWAGEGTLITKDQQELVHTSVSIKEGTFKKDWDSYLQHDGKHKLIIKYDDWFDKYSNETVASASCQKSYLESVGCFGFGTQKSIQGDRSRNYMITPLGFEMGIHKTCNATKVNKIIIDYNASIIDGECIDVNF
jgi:hypothetical protein